MVKPALPPTGGERRNDDPGTADGRWCRLRRQTMTQALPTDDDEGSAADAEFDYFADASAITVRSAVKSLPMLQARYSVLAPFVLENESLVWNFEV